MISILKSKTFLLTFLVCLFPYQLYAADDGSQMNEKFRINYAGYLPQASKKAFYLASNSGSVSWSITTSNCSGQTDDYVLNDKSSGDSFYIIDFSECVDELDNIRLQVGSDQSQPFSISNDPYGDIKYEFFDYFKDHENTSTFNQTIDNWNQSLSTTFNYVKDAGDDGAYPTNTAEASWALINMLESYPAINTYYSSNFNGAKTVFDQLEVLTDQFYHVFDHNGPLAIAKFHTNVNASWALCAPHNTGTCISKPETKATFATARTLAAMARLRLDYSTSAQATMAYDLASNAYSNATSNALVCNQSDSFGGEGGYYPDNDNYSIYRNPKYSRDHCVADQNNTQDDQYAALVELFLAATKLSNSADATRYKSDMTSHSRFNEASSYSWSSVVMEANLSLIANESIHNVDLSTLKANILTKSDEIIANQQHGYPGVTWDPHSNQWDSGDQDNADNNVRWGSHRNALNDARILMASAHIQQDLGLNVSSAQYARSAILVLDHISGLNAMALTMFTTNGYAQFEHSVERTHDGSDPTDSWAGKMVLGPNNWTNADDPDMPEFNTEPGLKMFAATGTGWASREISIDANASLVPLSYFTAEIAPQMLARAPIGGLADPINIPSEPTQFIESNLTFNSLTLNWNDNSGTNDDAASEFLIYQSDVNVKPNSALMTVPVGQTSVQVSQLTPQTEYYFWIEASNNVGMSQPVLLQVSTLEEPPIVNLIGNGDFSEVNSPWLCNIETGTANCSIIEEQYVIDITDGGTIDWHIQSLYSDISLINGQTYTFSFDAKALSPRASVIKVERSIDPWDDFTQVGVGQTLTTQMQRFSYTFTMTQSVNDARIAINVGGDTANVTIDNIWLANTDSDPCELVVGCGLTQEVYSIEVVQADNGHISPESMDLFEGLSQNFVITADPGFSISNVFLNSVPLGAVSNLNIQNIDSNQQITAVFTPDNIPVSNIFVSQNPNGMISPSTGFVAQGSNEIFTITADNGYVIADVIKNGVSLGAVSTVEFLYMQTDQTIEAMFTPAENSDNYLVTINAGLNGSADQSSMSVSQNDDLIINFTADPGYQLSEVFVNSESLGATNLVQLNDINENITVTANFEPIVSSNLSYSIQVSHSIGGAVSSGSIEVLNGQSFTFRVEPDDGYEIFTIRKNGQIIGNTSMVEFLDIGSDQSLNVQFIPIINPPKLFEVNILVTGLGSVTPSAAQIEQGKGLTLVLRPLTGNEVKSISINGVTKSITDNVVVSDVQENQDVVVTFAKQDDQNNANWYEIGSVPLYLMILLIFGIYSRKKRFLN